jgi:hypothetical protein
MSRTAEPRAATPVKVKGVKPVWSTTSQVPSAGPGASVKPWPCRRTATPLMVTALASR